MYILLSKAIVIEGVRGGGGVLTRICVSDIHANWCHFSKNYLCINERTALPILKPMDI